MHRLRVLRVSVRGHVLDLQKRRKELVVDVGVILVTVGRVGSFRISFLRHLNILVLTPDNLLHVVKLKIQTIGQEVNEVEEKGKFR